MSKLVVDSSVAVKSFVTEPYSREAIRILTEYQAGTIELLAPDLINAEVGSIAWKKHINQGFAPADAQLIVDNFQKLAWTFIPNSVLLSDAYRIATTHRRTVYDSLYIALSVRERCQFVTADEKLVNAVNTTYSSVIWIANWP